MRFLYKPSIYTQSILAPFSSESCLINSTNVRNAVLLLPLSFNAINPDSCMWWQPRTAKYKASPPDFVAAWICIFLCVGVCLRAPVLQHSVTAFTCHLGEQQGEQWLHQHLCRARHQEAINHHEPVHFEAL